MSPTMTARGRSCQPGAGETESLRSELIHFHPAFLEGEEALEALLMGGYHHYYCAEQLAFRL